MASRRARLWILGLASVVLFAVLALIDVGLGDAGGEGIVGFELAGTQERAKEILAAWGESGRSDAKLSLWLDYLYLAAYGAFGWLGLRAIADDAGRRRWAGQERLTRLASTGMLGAALCDAIENAALLLVLGGHGGTVTPRVAMTFALAKFALVALALACLLWWAGRRVISRRAT